MEIHGIINGKNYLIKKLDDRNHKIGFIEVNGSWGLHPHTFEETFILSDGKAYRIDGLYTKDKTTLAACSRNFPHGIRTTRTFELKTKGL